MGFVRSMAWETNESQPGEFANHYSKAFDRKTYEERYRENVLKTMAEENPGTW